MILPSFSYLPFSSISDLFWAACQSWGRHVSHIGWADWGEWGRKWNDKEKIARIWQALERVNGPTLALRKGVRRTATYQCMHGYQRLSSFSYHTHFPLCLFCLYTNDSAVIFISHSHFSLLPVLPLHPWFSCHLISPIFLYPRFILSGLPELRKTCFTHRMGWTEASEGHRLGRTVES